MLAGRQGSLPGDVCAFYSKVIILVVDFAFFHIDDPATKGACLRDNHTISIAVFQFNWRSNGIGAVLYVNECVFRHPGHAGINRQGGAIAHQVGSPGDRRVETLRSAVIDGQDVILDRFLREKVLKLLQLGRILRRHIVSFAEVFSDVVKFPYVLRERWERHHQPRNGVPCASYPAIVIDAPISKHFEILSGMRLLGFGIIKGINHRCSIERFLRRPVHALWKRQPGCLQDSRCDVRDMGKLRTELSFCFNARRPMDNYTVGGSAIV